MKHRLSCIVVDDEPMARSILEAYIKKLPNLDLIKSCKNAIEAFQVLNQDEVDIIFLDINMPEISGLSFAKSINSKTSIIFTTAYREYAVEGFDLAVTDYLLKPISFERFIQSIDKVNKNSKKESQPIEEDQKNNFLFVRSERKMVKINLEELLFIESLSDYLKINTSDTTIITRETISNLENKLSKNHFLRIHRSFIININKIDSYTNEFIEIGDKALPISRTYKDEVISKLQNI